MKTFFEFSLPTAVQTALETMNFVQPTPIQSQAIPVALEGRDVLGTAQTGTGKTGAFCIPLVSYLINNPSSKGLILTPTRELATQVLGIVKQLTKNTPIRSALLIGGDSMYKQFDQLKKTPQVIVGTPGRIIDHLERGSLSLNQVGFLVLDEMDRMLEMGFSIQLDHILEYLTSERQTLMFSATLPKQILKMTEQYMVDPVRISLGSVNAPVEKIDQKTLRVSDQEKYGVLVDELQNREGSVIIFTKTKRGAENLARKLMKEDMNVTFMHGDLQQRKRTRVISAFREKRFTILVATDVAARGLDVPHVEHIVNYELPRNPQDYIHRIGRTARAGAQGHALNLVSDQDRSAWSAISKMLHGVPEKPFKSEKKRSFSKKSYAKKKSSHFFQKRKSKKKVAA
ncbi:MAG: DEAD/DEAH box helicase [Bdellovibrionota bacterium]